MKFVGYEEREQSKEVYLRLVTHEDSVELVIVDQVTGIRINAGSVLVIDSTGIIIMESLPLNLGLNLDIHGRLVVNGYRPK